MIDEFVRKVAAPATVKAAKTGVRITGHTVRSLFAVFQDWFRDFRWIEFTATVGAAFGAGLSMATTIGLSEGIGRKIGIFGAIVGAICYIRSPKTRWDCTDDINDEDSLRQSGRGK